MEGQTRKNEQNRFPGFALYGRDLSVMMSFRWLYQAATAGGRNVLTEFAPQSCTFGREKLNERAVEKYKVETAIKLGDYNVGLKDNMLTLPLYMTFLLTEI
ncbi:MAG: hypothetical protein K2K23_04290 [Muribaculaceae bacterium]|nr:hypothetical protein [Muribaculaceae bacterium]